jgi:hypothetical protein
MHWLKELMMSMKWPDHGGKRQRLAHAHSMNNRGSRRKGAIDAQGHKLSAMCLRMREICGCNLEKAGLV